MFVADEIKQYSILDTGDGMKLEDWNGILLARPDPQVIWEKQFPRLWEKAHGIYHRSTSGGGRWEFQKSLPERWTISFRNLKFYVRPTNFKHTGLFPEQSANWAFLMDKIAAWGKRPKVLNLFAYSGGASVACAASGAQVTHVDAAKSMNAWAKENLALSGLEDRPVRFLADDCLKFVLREQRRGNRYDGIIMDPPSYGRGAGGSVWKIEDNLFELVKEAAKLLTDHPLFFLISSYTTGLSSVVCANMLQLVVKSQYGGDIHGGDLCIPVRNSQVLLPCGTSTRWMGKDC